LIVNTWKDIMPLSPITLTGSNVRLIPLQLEHADELARIGVDPQIWTFMRYGPVTTLDRMRDFIDYLLKQQALGTDLPFTVQHLASGNLVGMTRFMNIEPANRALEIGGTWYGVDYQRTGVNTECKFLLLEYAFETLNIIRVQFKADLRNERSQRAIERIGAVKEGMLRDHMILPDGFIRTTVVYSILAAEWPAVKQRLTERMNR
jgi:N-acetyltransferase